MFNIGDKVIVKDLKRYPQDCGVMPEMEECLGKELTIKDFYDIKMNWFRVEENMYIWDARWFEPVVDINIEETEIMALF